MITRILIYILIAFVIYKCINLHSRYELRRVGVWIPLSGLTDRLRLEQKLAVNGASSTFDTGRNTPCITFIKRIGRGKPTRFQMILRREDYMAEAFDKARETLSRKGIPLRISYGSDNDEYKKFPRRMNILKSPFNNKANSDQNIAQLIVECGRNLELADVCAQTVFTEAFGVFPNANVRLVLYTSWQIGGIGFGNYSYSHLFKVPATRTFEDLLFIVKKLDESDDEEAFVIFGSHAHAKALPELRKWKIDDEIVFTLDVPSIDRTSANAVRTLRKEGEQLKKIDQSKYGPIFRMELGASHIEIAEKLRKIFLEWFSYKTDATFSYRLVEVITADWKPFDTDIEETKSD